MLGVQYLWIDKLCIIQHDKNDWASEGSRMAQIFEGSFLTIGAAISKDDTDSLFFNDERHAPSLKSYTGRIWKMGLRIPSTLGYLSTITQPIVLARNPIVKSTHS